MHRALLACFLASSVTCSAAKNVHHLLHENADVRILHRNQWVLSLGFPDRPITDPRTVSIFSPVTACPWTLLRSNSITDVFDGGKWTCGLPEMAAAGPTRKCVVYSFGSAGNDIFEKHLLSIIPHCEVHIFDPTCKPLPPPYHFHEYGVCASGTSFKAGEKVYPCRSMTQIVEELGHKHIDILKMDVDGAEWGLFNTTDWSKLRIGQFLVEIHDLGGLNLTPSLGAKDLAQHVWGPLEKAGLLQYIIEPVCDYCAGQYELAFLNRNWLPEGHAAIAPTE